MLHILDTSGSVTRERNLPDTKLEIAIQTIWLPKYNSENACRPAWALWGALTQLAVLDRWATGGFARPGDSPPGP